MLSVVAMFDAWWYAHKRCLLPLTRPPPTARTLSYLVFILNTYDSPFLAVIRLLLVIDYRRCSRERASLGFIKRFLGVGFGASLCIALAFCPSSDSVEYIPSIPQLLRLLVGLL